ncbi:hypothetical protein B0H16DRAFT_1458265 [Mycena metata]|uniref:Uncharacterized protein n=1 Tax=Mycena metata TaxID=1033252 RepID=A0AAD7J3M0_9AGAR|nr:hypothetical protein B0H16DRAFT_1458265 [Mycena metata]
MLTKSTLRRYLHPIVPANAAYSFVRIATVHTGRDWVPAGRAAEGRCSFREEQSAHILALALQWEIRYLWIPLNPRAPTLEAPTTTASNSPNTHDRFTPQGRRARIVRMVHCVPAQFSAWSGTISPDGWIRDRQKGILKVLQHSQHTLFPEHPHELGSLRRRVVGQDRYLDFVEGVACQCAPTSIHLSELEAAFFRGAHARQRSTRDDVCCTSGGGVLRHCGKRNSGWAVKRKTLKTLSIMDNEIDKLNIELDVDP